jgi:YgiT-type zinc finger domain-containing protein
MKCVVCKGGETRPGMTTVTLEREGLTLVMKEVPAEICVNCGEDYVDDKIAHEIMMLADKMAQTGTQIDVRRYIPGSVSC